MIDPRWNLPEGFKGCRVIMLATGAVVDVPRDPFVVLDLLFKKHPPDQKEKAAADARWDAYHGKVPTETPSAAVPPKETRRTDGRADGDRAGEAARDSLRGSTPATTLRPGPTVDDIFAPRNPPAPVDRPKPPPPASPPEPKRPGVRDTSMIAYRALQYSGEIGAQQRKVLAVWLDGKRDAFWTRQELTKLTGLPINTICGRVNELLDAPLNLLYEADSKKTCTVTGNDVNAIGLATVPGGES